MNKTQRWQKIAENRLLIMGSMAQDIADLVTALELAETRLKRYKGIRAGEFWDTNDEYALKEVEQALAQVEDN